MSAGRSTTAPGTLWTHIAGRENYALEHGRSPEDILVEREERAAHLRLLAALPEALAHATPTQARRIRAYYIAGINQPKIARMEGVHSSKVSVAIRRGPAEYAPLL